MTTLGKEIKRLRLDKGITLRELALKAEISPPFLSDIENGKRMPSIEKLGSIAKVLSVNITDLEQYDGRITEKVKDWFTEKPIMGSLMRKMANMSERERDKVVSQIEKAVKDSTEKK